MVSISMIAVSANTVTPAAVSLAALLENCCTYTDMTLLPACGTRLEITNSRRRSDNSVNTGKAVITISVIVTSGTSASKVVNVRLPHN